MRVLFFGDLQTNGKHAAYSSFLQSTMEFLMKTIDEERPDIVVNLGDLMDTKSVVEVDDLVWAWKLTREIEMECKPPDFYGYPTHMLLMGNHDMSDKKGGRSSVEVMEGINTDIFTRLSTVETSEGLLVIIPYTEDMPGMWKKLSEIENKDSVFGIFAHTNWLGCRLTPTFVSDKGINPVDMENMFPNAHMFAGHYHHPLDLGRLHIVGSPLHKDFNDILGEIPRGFTLWDSKTGEITRIENPNTYHCLDLRFDDEELMKNAASSLRPMKDKLRVKISVPSAIVDETLEEFDGFLWKSVVPNESSITSLYQGHGIKICSTPGEVIRRGVETAPDDLDSEVLEKIGQAIFDNVGGGAV